MISSVITERSPLCQAVAGSVTGGWLMGEEIPGVFDGVLTDVGVCRGIPGLAIGIKVVRPEGASLDNRGLLGVGWLIVLEHHLRSRHSQVARSQVMPTVGR
jgi:hypothetical protein